MTMADAGTRASSESRSDFEAHDLEKQSSHAEVAEKGTQDAPVVPEKPGARVGLTLTQFWIVIAA
jgi:hypothetical protein